MGPVDVTAKLICVFFFAYAKSWFSHDAAQILNEAGFQHDCMEDVKPMQ